MLEKKQSPSQVEEAKAGNLKVQAEVLGMKISADVTMIQKSGGMNEDEAYDDLLVGGYH